MGNIPSNFGSLVRMKRRESGMSQKDLAKVVGSSEPVISRIENGKGKHDPVLLHRLKTRLMIEEAEIVMESDGDETDEETLTLGTPPSTFGAWVKARRIAIGKTQDELAKLIGVNMTWISRIESGEKPGAVSYERLCTRLRINATEVIPPLPEIKTQKPANESNPVSPDDKRSLFELIMELMERAKITPASRVRQAMNIAIKYLETSKPIQQGDKQKE